MFFVISIVFNIEELEIDWIHGHEESNLMTERLLPPRKIMKWDFRFQ